MSEQLREYENSIFTPAFIIQILKDNNLALRKHFGQNLLINRDLARRILEYSELHITDRVLEIGPGLGTMTFLLAERVSQVVAVEVDRGFAQYLSRIIEGLGQHNIHLIQKNFLSMECEELPLQSRPNKVISNFPYNVAIKALISIAESFETVEMIVGTVQRELADRVSALPGSKEYSAVSVFLQYLMDVKVMEKRILPQSFFPIPEVDSAVILLSRRKDHKGRDYLLFKQIVRAAFSHRRQRLVKNLKSLDLSLTSVELERIVEDLFGNPSVRAEAVSVEGFICLCEALWRAGVRSSS